MKRLRWIIPLLVLLVGDAALAVDAYAERTAKRMNGVYRRSPFKPSPRVAELHQRLTLVDLHADALLWGRNLNARGDWGHVDVPRLLEGNVAVQVFGVVTKTPEKMNVERNDDSTDNIRLLAMARRWPPSTWNNLLQRALYLAGQLDTTAEASEGRLVLVRSRADLERFLERRRSEPRLVAGLLALEGLHVLEGQVDHIDTLHAAGFRMLGLAHFFDNEVSGSAHGVNKGGLSPLGRQVLQRMEAQGITVDLAHASPRAFEDALAAATRPVVVSHTGVRGTCPNNRNLTDEQLRKVARNGGVVGIGYWQTATCGKDAAAIARAIRYAVNVAGVEHVGLGSDFDGSVATPFDTAGLAELTAALLQQGFSPAELEKLMGGNALRVLKQNLPAE